MKDVVGSERVLILSILPALAWNGLGRDAYISVTTGLRLEIGPSRKQKSSALIKISHDGFCECDSELTLQ